MTQAFYQDHWVTIYCDDARKVLPMLDDESIQCVVTSPPYWGLRDYGIEPSIWGGDETCEHEWQPTIEPGGQGTGLSFRRDRAAGRKRGGLQPGFCVRCHAWLGCLGLEPTPELYVEHLVEIFREVRRVLRKDGTVWLVIGDSYATGAGKVGDCPGGGKQGERWKGHRGIRQDGKHKYIADHMGPIIQPNRMPIPGLKPKDLCMIPARVALALQADGWWLRSDIIWAKPNPMPESVADRPTKAHEYLFLLAKSEKYFYDGEAIKEPQEEHERRRRLREKSQGLNTIYRIAADGKTGQNPQGKTGSVRNVTRRHTLAQLGTRNKRSVWTIPTIPFPEAHFAVFPKTLIEPCIKAGSRPGDTVMDLFAGSGTTGEVAKELNRKAVLIDPKEEYCEISIKRLRQEVFDFSSCRTEERGLK